MSTKSPRQLELDHSVEAASIDYVQAISRAANGLHRDEAIELIANHLSETLQADHRTLQAIMVAGVLKAIAKYGNDASCDPRNEAAVKTCRQLAETIKYAVPFPFI